MDPLTIGRLIEPSRQFDCAIIRVLSTGRQRRADTALQCKLTELRSPACASVKGSGMMRDAGGGKACRCDMIDQTLAPNVRRRIEKMMRHLENITLLVVLACCQPLPHPFADDRPPESFMTVRDSTGVSIGPISGVPIAAASKLGGAVAKALQTRDIPASNRTASLSSYQLIGWVDASPSRRGQMTVSVRWRLSDASGRLIGERIAKLRGASSAWLRGDDNAVSGLAVASADALAPMLADEAPTEVPSVAAAIVGPRLAIASVQGAPGDGDKSLLTALTAVLKQLKLNVVANTRGRAADLILIGQVTATPVRADKQHVKIVWHLRRADGSEIGTVGQENDVPTGSLDKAWGDIAYSVATAAGSGVRELIVRAAAGDHLRSVATQHIEN